VGKLRLGSESEVVRGGRRKIRYATREVVIKSDSEKESEIINELQHSTSISRPRVSLLQIVVAVHFTCTMLPSSQTQ